MLSALYPTVFIFFFWLLFLIFFFDVVLLTFNKKYLFTYLPDQFLVQINIYFFAMLFDM